jgi:hypothetical protein
MKLLELPLSLPESMVQSEPRYGVLKEWQLERQLGSYKLIIGIVNSEATRRWNKYEGPRLLNATLNDELQNLTTPSKDTTKENIKNHIVEDLIIGANGALSSVR